MSDDQSVRDRLRRRLRASTVREVRRLRARVSALEAAAAENRSLRPELERVVAEVATRLEAFERGLSHASTDRTDG